MSDDKFVRLGGALDQIAEYLGERAGELPKIRVKRNGVEYECEVAIRYADPRLDHARFMAAGWKRLAKENAQTLRYHHGMESNQRARHVALGKQILVEYVRQTGEGISLRQVLPDDE